MQSCTALPSPVERTTAHPTCRVLNIHDGDTLALRCGVDRERVRLWCIDAPELDQAPLGRQARDRLRELACPSVQLRRIEQDRYGRTVGEVFTLDGQSLNLALVQTGQAAVYRRYCPAAHYQAAEQQARGVGVGIWSQAGMQQRPWDWRRQ